MNEKLHLLEMYQARKLYYYLLRVNAKALTLPAFELTLVFSALSRQKLRYGIGRILACAMEYSEV